MRKTRRASSTIQRSDLAERDIEFAIRSGTNVLLSGGDDTLRLSLAYLLCQRLRRHGDPLVVVDSHRSAALDEGVRLPEHGILLIEELGVLSLRMQIELIRLIDHSDAQWTGGPAEHARRLRVISTTACNLLDRIASREFLGNLFYRLNTINLVIPRRTRPAVSVEESLATAVM
jgi:transcriptional regulator of acetoin/glycerol metabolism